MLPAAHSTSQPSSQVGGELPAPIFNPSSKQKPPGLGVRPRAPGAATAAGTARALRAGPWACSFASWFLSSHAGRMFSDFFLPSRRFFQAQIQSVIAGLRELDLTSQEKGNVAMVDEGVLGRPLQLPSPREGGLKEQKAEGSVQPKNQIP